jgi:integrase
MWYNPPQIGGSVKQATGWVQKKMKRGSVFFVACASYTNKATGRRHQLEKWFTNKRAATDYLPTIAERANLAGELGPVEAVSESGGLRSEEPEIGTEPNTSFSGKTLFEDWCAHYKGTFAVAPLTDSRTGRVTHGIKTWRDQHSIIDRLLIPEFKGRQINDILYSDLVKFKSRLLQTPVVVTKKKGAEEIKTRERSLGHVHRVLTVLRTILQRAEDDDLILKNPFKKGRPLIQMSQEPERIRLVSTKEEVDMIGVAYADSRFDEILLVSVIARDTGMRQHAVCGLEWSRINFDDEPMYEGNEEVARGYIRFIDHKGSGPKEIKRSMTPRVRELLMKWKGYCDRVKEGTTKRDSRRIPPDWYESDRVFFSKRFPTKRWVELREKVGAPDLHFHDIRHTVGTELAMSDMSNDMIARALAHTQASTAFRYHKATPELQRQIASRLGGKPLVGVISEE